MHTQHTAAAALHLHTAAAVATAALGGALAAAAPDGKARCSGLMAATGAVVAISSLPSLISGLCFPALLL